MVDTTTVVPILGTLLTAIGLGVGVVFGFEAFGPRTTVVGSAVRGTLVLGYVAVCLLGTVWIHDDARKQAETNRTWSPQPWAYLGGGTAVVAATIAWWFRAALLASDRVVPLLAGVLVVSACLASVVAGPVYLAQRYRHLGQH